MSSVTLCGISSKYNGSIALLCSLYSRNKKKKKRKKEKKKEQQEQQRQQQ